MSHIPLPDTPSCATQPPPDADAVPSRPEFVQHALESIALQDYPLSLVDVLVVDDSPPELRLPLPVGSSVTPTGLRVNYVQLSALQSIGAKRNLGLQLATGEIVAHWCRHEIQ